MLYAWMYFEDKFKDFFLPQHENWTEELFLGSHETGWENDIVIKARSLDGSSYVTCPDGYIWSGKPSTFREIRITDNLKLYMENREKKIGIIFNHFEIHCTSFTKYQFSGERRLEFGRAEHNDLQFDSLVISENHGVFLRTGDGSCEYTDDSTNGTYINGTLIHKKSHLLSFGDIISFASGLKILYLVDILAINNPIGLKKVDLSRYEQRYQLQKERNAVMASPYIQHHRAPRLLKKSDQTVIEIEAPLPKSNQTSLPLILTIGPSLTMVLPMLMGYVMSGSGGNYASAGLTMIGTSSLLAVSWGLINVRYRKRQGELLETTRSSLFVQYIHEMEARLKALNDKERARLLDSNPSYAECLFIAKTRSIRLWERTPLHQDFLTLRLGIGDVPLPNELTTSKKKLSIIDDPLRDEPEKLIEKYGVIEKAPLTISLLDEPILGILGKSRATALAQGLLMQLTAIHSYYEVQIVILTNEKERSQWEWAKWLPHVFPAEDKQLRMIASKPSSIHKVLSFLDDLLMLRAESIPEGKEEAIQQPLPHIIVLCTDPEILDNHPFMRHILHQQLGISLIMTAPSMEMLPKECRVIASVEENPSSLYKTEGDIQRFTLEYIDAHLLDDFARSIAPLRVKDTAENTSIPTMVTFLDLYGVRDINDLDVWRFWNENKAYEGLRSTIGLRAGAQPFVLDISDKYHGPHGLIAGTTGSGKSVMLQTYILSLALNYSPKQVQFILIDYKGGGMADVFRNLPHVAGSIDNLQGERTTLRALASIQGEIRRREAMFRHAGVSNIDDYIRLFNSDPAEEPLAHLIIIVDEFAELKKEQPEFMHELVSTSRVGRSVGLHLILATQKPSNSVDDEIWSNTRFRICLRVQGRGDSIDMLKRPDAAYIKGMGRCYVQVGNDEIFDQVQTSWSGAAYRPNDLRPDELPRLLDDIGQPISIRRKKPKAETHEYTEMDAVLDRIHKTAKEHEEPFAKKLWMDEMDSYVSLQQIQEYANNSFNGTDWPEAKTGLAAVIGIADDIANQKHVPLFLDLEKNKNHAIIGMSGSGKTMLLQTAAVSFATAYPPDRLQMYVFSLSSRILGCLSTFPHVGDIIYGEDTTEQSRLVDLLDIEDGERRKLFAQAMTDSFFEYNRSLDPKDGLSQIPVVIVIIDRLSQLLENLDEDRTQKLTYLLREGSNHGVYFLVTAMGLNEIPFKLRDFFNGIALQLNDFSDYSDILRKHISQDMGKILPVGGRGIAVIDETSYEIMTALYGDKKGDAARAREIAKLGNMMNESWEGPLPKSVPRIPDNLTWTDMVQSEMYIAAQKDAWELPLAYSVQTGNIETIHLDKDFSWLITGAAGSGKTNLLKVIALTFQARKAKIYVTGSEEWIGFAKERGLYFISLNEPAGDQFFSELLDEIRKRRTARQEALKKNPSALDSLARDFLPIVILIDDAEKYIPLDNINVVKILKETGSAAAKYGVYLFISVSYYAFQQVKFKEPFLSQSHQQRTIALGGRLSDSSLPSIPGSYAIRNQALPSGEAFLLNNGSIVHVKIPRNVYV